MAQAGGQGQRPRRRRFAHPALQLPGAGRQSLLQAVHGGKESGKEGHTGCGASVAERLSGAFQFAGSIIIQDLQGGQQAPELLAQVIRGSVAPELLLAHPLNPLLKAPQATLQILH